MLGWVESEAELVWNFGSGPDDVRLASPKRRPTTPDTCAACGSSAQAGSSKAAPLTPRRATPRGDASTDSTPSKWTHAERELRVVERNLVPSREGTPTPQPRRSTKVSERKSNLSQAYIVDRDEEGDGAELERAAVRDESGSEGEGDEDERSEEESVDERSERGNDRKASPSSRPSDSVKPPPSSMPLVSLSQVDNLPPVPRKRRWKDDDYEVFVRSELADQDAARAFLASRWLGPNELRRLEATGLITYKRGKFLEAEKSAIREHLQTFQKTHDMSDGDLVDLIMSKGRYVERSRWPSFWFDLLPGRPVRSVVDAVKRMYDPRGRKGMWLPSEDRALLQAYELYPNQWRKISEAVDRSELDCRDRYKQELRDRSTRATGVWSLKECAELDMAVRRACADLGRDPLKDAVPWDTVVELMGRQRTIAQCRKKWRDALKTSGEGGDVEHVAAGPHNECAVDRRRILQRLRDIGVEHERDIVWKHVPTQGWAVRPALLRNIWGQLRRRIDVPNRDDMPLPELLDRIEAGLDDTDARVAQSGASRSARKRAQDDQPSRVKRMKTKKDSAAAAVAH